MSERMQGEGEGKYGLILCRELDEQIYIVGKDRPLIILTVTDICGDRVRLGIKGDQGYGIHRREIARERGLEHEAVLSSIAKGEPLSEEYFALLRNGGRGDE